MKGWKTSNLQHGVFQRLPISVSADCTRNVSAVWGGCPDACRSLREKHGAQNKGGKSPFYSVLGYCCGFWQTLKRQRHTETQPEGARGEGRIIHSPSPEKNQRLWGERGQKWELSLNISREIELASFSKRYTFWSWKLLTPKKSCHGRGRPTMCQTLKEFIFYIASHLFIYRWGN